MNNIYKRIRNIIFIVFSALVILVAPMSSEAAQLSVEFGADRYDKNSGAEVAISAYLKSDVAISSYSVVFEYDRSRLKAVNGYNGLDAANGTFTCSASGDHLTNIKIWLTFEATSGGDAYVKVLSATAVGTDGTEYEIYGLDEAQVRLKGEDVSEQNLLELETADDSAELLENDSSDESDESEPNATEDNDGNEGYGMETDIGEEASTDTGAEGNIEGTANNEDGSDNADSGLNRRDVIYWLAVVVIIAVPVTILLVSTFGRKKKNSGEYADGESEYGDDEELVFNGEQEYSEEETYSAEETEEETYSDEESEETSVDEEPSAAAAIIPQEAVFAAENVTMQCKVKIRNQNAGSVPEYETINVLDKANVEIYKGEILSVDGKHKREMEAFIGLLVGKYKITSGDITHRPGRFRIVTTRSYFDLKLPVKTNIYRSGALMGHPKSVIDKCYSRIVKFAGAEKVLEVPASKVPETTIHKIEIALALLDNRADMLILANVFKDCDEAFVNKSAVVLRKMSNANMTVVLFGELPKAIADSCDRTLYIADGHID